MQEQRNLVVTLRVYADSFEECEDLLTFEDWCVLGSGDMTGKIVPLFPHLRKITIIEAKYLGAVMLREGVFLAQVLLQVETSGNTIEKLSQTGWIRPEFKNRIVFKPEPDYVLELSKQFSGSLNVVYGELKFS